MDRTTDRWGEGRSDRREGVDLLYFLIFPVTRLSLVWRKIHCNQSWHGPFQRWLRPKTKKSFALMGLSLARFHTHSHIHTHTLSLPRFLYSFVSSLWLCCSHNHPFSSWHAWPNCYRNGDMNSERERERLAINDGLSFSPDQFSTETYDSTNI